MIDASQTTLCAQKIADFLHRLESASRLVDELHPGDGAERQPVHTVYGGAHLFRADLAARIGATALRTLTEYGPTAPDFAERVGLPGYAAGATPTAAEEALAAGIYQRVVDKLRREPVEDYRIDFEDGFGTRTDEEEDAAATAAAHEVARGLAAGSLPPYLGIRIKSLAGEAKGRGLRTLDRFFTALLDESGGRLPPWFAVTLPKLTHPEQVAVGAEALASIEAAAGLAAGALKLELMIETTQSVLHLGADGRAELALPAFLAAAERGGGRRPVAVHFGAYDYTAACGITAPFQTLDHPACELARGLSQIALAGTGIWLVDGATTRLPIAPHRGAALGDEQVRENREAIARAWQESYQQIRRALRCGYYQGWDLHPAQLPVRYAACYAFFQEGLALTAERLRNFLHKAAQATRVGNLFDDAATGQGLLNYFRRAHACGAITAAELEQQTSLTVEQLRTRSFAKLLAARAG